MQADTAKNAHGLPNKKYYLCPSMGHLENEKKTIRHLVALYCRGREGNAGLCDDCRELLEYAEGRLDKCRYGEAKPVCKKCPKHCYHPKYRERIREVMRYAGPRLIWRHPAEAMKHLFRNSLHVSQPNHHNP